MTGRRADLSTLLKLLSDPGRVRILWLLSQAELAVHELQQLLEWGQSRLSTQLGLLRDKKLLQLRREGKWSFYSLLSPDTTTSQGRVLSEILAAYGKESGMVERPLLRSILEARLEETRKRFAEDSAYLGEESVPGRTWENVARSFFALLSPCRILDLGAGDGIVGCLAASAGHEVTLVDQSDTQLARARDRAAREGARVQCVQADFCETGLPAQSFDRVLISHALHHASVPSALLAEAARLLMAGGEVWILDLVAHQEEWMRVGQGDVWLGFEPEHMEKMLTDAGFDRIRILHPGADPRHPRLHSLCAAAVRKVL